MAERGAEVWLTGSARAAEWLRAREERRLVAAGAAAWETPAILSLGAWLERAWPQAGGARLLSNAQEHEVWRRTIAADAGREEAALLDLDATAQAAAGAWALVCGWELPLSGNEWEQREETVRFRRWARRFAGWCRKREWISGAELTGAVGKAVRTRGLVAPASVRLSGFDEFTPAQSRLIAALKAGGAEVEFAAPVREPGEMRVVAAGDAEQEWRAAAAWAGERLGEIEAAGPGRGEGLIGVILPDLASARAAVERAFQAALDPARMPGDSSPPRFQLSLGLPLSQWPVAAGALALLEFAAGGDRLDMATAGALVTSPFLAGAVREREARAQWRRCWAAKRLAFILRGALTGEDARRQAALLARALARAERRRAGWPAKLSHRGWARAFTRLLETAGWPGEAALTSAEYQTATAWSDLLETFCGLDLVAERCDAATALRRLRRLAQGRMFQPRADAASVQVMGWLEAAGFEFAQVWMCGAHDGALPAAPAPNPFLPRALQLERALPRSSASREAAFAEILMSRVRRSTAALTVSFPENDENRPLRPSPLLGATKGCKDGPVAGAAAAIPIEEIEDSRAPAASEEEAHGGTALLKDQSACGFRAFAHARLRAMSAREAPAGLGADSRGTVLHQALRAFWGAFDSHGAVKELSEEALGAAIDAAAGEAVSRETLLAHRPGLAALERERVRRLLAAWMKIEMRRTPFRVIARESPRPGEIAGLRLSLRLDRIDEVENEGRILIDYKSGAVSTRSWTPPRPEEPQLLVYLVTEDEPGRVCAIAFAGLKPGKMGFRVAARANGIVVQHPQVPPKWDDAIAAWRHELERLARAFLDGDAAVDPRPKACETCDLTLLCRIHETELVRPQPQDEVDDAD